MVSLIEYFCMNMGLSIPYGDFYDMFDDIEDMLIKDSSEFVCVDGEEGDYGVIKYYTKAGNELFAVETNNGGDDIDVEFTNVARIVYGNKIKEIISDKLEKMELYDKNN